MMAERKIGVLTFHRCINYGSYWQARCLVEGLRARGEDAVLLDHGSSRIDRVEWRCALQPALPGATPASDRARYAVKTRKFFDAFTALPLSAAFDIDDPAQVEPYDLIMVGSDEVWNLRHPWYGGKALFFGVGIDAPSLAAYAASFGNQSASAPLDPWWAEQLQRFERISVRDANAQKMVAAALGREVPIVLDPCLTFGDCVPQTPAPGGEPYIAVYGHSFPGWFAADMQQWARSRGFKLVSIGYRNDWADEQRIEVGPEDFPALIANAEAVATNFFHGCVFSLLNNKPFAAVASAYRLNKLRDLTALVDAERHLICPEARPADYAPLLAQPPSPAIAARIDGLRAQSKAYLDAVLA